MAGQQVETFIDEADGRGLGRQVRAGHRQLAHGRFSMRPHDVRLQFGGEHGALMIDAMEGLSHQKAACYIVLCTNSPSKHLAFGA